MRRAAVVGLFGRLFEQAGTRIATAMLVVGGAGRALLGYSGLERLRPAEVEAT